MSWSPMNPLDPLEPLITREFAPWREALPQVDLSFDVEIAGALAVVRTRRVFRHDGAETLEAILVFPTPLRAVLYGLTVEIDGRRLGGVARRRDEGRDVYEDAIATGRTTVLYEEVLRGIHMLSVGHLPPGREVVVETLWTAPLAPRDDRLVLRIPLTLGDVYGVLDRPETDVPGHAPLGGRARLRVRARRGRVFLDGCPLGTEAVEVPTHAPIELAVLDATLEPVVGRTADGRRVELAMEPVAAGRAPLDVAVLVDRSGSMGEPVAGGARYRTKHAAVVRGLARILGTLGPEDRIELWQFDHVCERVGATFDVPAAGWPVGASPARALRALLRRLDGPGGGTELGGAIARVLERTPCRDLLVITDGKSWALDVEALAARGRRVTAVLVGEDSLEAMIGHLAALTGGELHLALGRDVAGALGRALAGLRRPGRPPVIRPDGGSLEAVVDGLAIRARWGDGDVPDGSDACARAAAALATALALPALPPARAAEAALAEGLVTHMTSLVLVDEEGERHEGLPHTVRIPLDTPRTEVRFLMARLAAPDEYVHTLPKPDDDLADLVDLASRIDWRAQAPRLARGDLSGLDPDLRARIRELAQDEAVVRLARDLGLDPVQLVLWLLAREWGDDRHARRLARRIATGLAVRPPDAGLARLRDRLAERLRGRAELSQDGEG